MCLFVCVYGLGMVSEITLGIHLIRLNVQIEGDREREREREKGEREGEGERERERGGEREISSTDILYT